MTEVWWEYFRWSKFWGAKWERGRSNTWKFLRMGQWTQHGASQTLLYTAHAAYYMCADVWVWQSVAVSNDDWASLLPFLLLRNAKYYKISTTSFLSYLVLQDGPFQLHIHIMIFLKGTMQLFVFNRSNKIGWDCYLLKALKIGENFNIKTTIIWNLLSNFYLLGNPNKHYYCDLVIAGVFELL